jgi:hypothetical protein
MDIRRYGPRHELAGHRVPVAAVLHREASDRVISACTQWLVATNWKASSTVLIPAFEPSELVSIFEN